MLKALFCWKTCVGLQIVADFVVIVSFVLKMGFEKTNVMLTLFNARGGDFLKLCLFICIKI